MTRYVPSRNYLIAGIVAFVLAGVSAWFGAQWAPSLVPTILLFIASLALIFLGLQAAIEVHPRHLRVGDRVVPWADVRRVDRTDWISPLVVHLTLADRKRLLLVYPGDLDSAKQLLRQLRRSSFNAVIDGIPYGDFWMENSGTVEAEAGEMAKPLAGPRYPVLREEDEADVERLYQRLKAVGHLDPKGSDEN